MDHAVLVFTIFTETYIWYARPERHTQSCGSLEGFTRGRDMVVN